MALFSLRPSKVNEGSDLEICYVKEARSFMIKHALYTEGLTEQGHVRVSLLSGLIRWFLEGKHGRRWAGFLV